jgi:hypothetical protein
MTYTYPDVKYLQVGPDVDPSVTDSVNLSGLLLPIGTEGQLLSVASGTDTGLDWIAPPTTTKTLQEAYNDWAAASPEVITLDNTRKGIKVRDASPSLGSSEELLAVQNNGGSTSYLSVKGDGNVCLGTTTALNSSVLTANGTVSATGAYLSGLTSGSVLFAGSSGVVSQDNSSLYYNSTNHRLGIGTTGPLTALHIAESTTASGVITIEQAFGDTDCPDIYFKKARGNVGSPTVITTGDDLGKISFYGYSGAGGYVEGASIRATSEGTVATTRVPGNLTFWTGTDAAPTVPTERMRITSAGRVGIGTNNPGSIFNVADNTITPIISFTSTLTGVSTNGPTLQLYEGASNYWQIVKRSSTYTNQNDLLLFEYYNGATWYPAFSLTKDGKTGIGIATPSSPLQVSGSLAIDIPLVTVTNNTATTDFIQGIHVLAPNVGANHITGYAVGQAFSARNAGYMGFKYSSTGSTSNWLSFGGHSVDDALVIQMTGNVGVGTTAPAGKFSVTQTITATGALKGIVYTGAVNTNQTLSTEIPSVTITTAGRQWAAGALTTQREVLITQPTYTFVSASTITDAATLGIAGAPIKSTNATITNTHAILVQAGAVSTAASSYGLTVNAQTGGSANYAAQFIGGNVGIGTAAPGSLCHIASSTTATAIATIEQASADTDDPDLIFKKARGTVGTPTVVSSGDNLGTISFAGYSGAGGYVTGASIKATAEATVATTRVPANISFYTGTDAAPTVLTERMRITSSGYTGIGTTAPVTHLQVQGNAYITGTSSLGNSYLEPECDGYSETSYSGNYVTAITWWTASGSGVLVWKYEASYTGADPTTVVTTTYKSGVAWRKVTDNIYYASGVETSRNRLVSWA